jgi:cephalosporin hydroxylase
MHSREIQEEALLKRAPFRMIHLDASHHAQDVLADLRLLVPHLHEYGAVFIDDYEKKDWPGVKQGTDEFMANEGKHLKLLVERFNKAIYVTEAMYEHVKFIVGVVD